MLRQHKFYLIFVLYKLNPGFFEIILTHKLQLGI